MSVVIKKASGNGSVILCKANDISAFDLINPEEAKDPEIEKSKNQIKDLSKFGFRYFIILKRELDEEFFEDLGMEGVNSKETLEEEIKKNIEAHKETDAENKFIDEMLAKVAENTEVDIPEEMIDEEVHRLMHRMDEQLKMQGLSLEIYQEYAKVSHEDLHKQFEEEAKKNVLYRLILEELVKVEKIEVTLEEAEKEADNLASKYGMTREDLLKEFGGIDMIMYDMEVRKVFDKLKEYNK